MKGSKPAKIRVVDSHTGGEPTRVILTGGPRLGTGPLSARVERFHKQFDWFRSALTEEPRGTPSMVGALLGPPHRTSSLAGVIFFNSVGYLGMCGHGTIGVVTTLAHLGKLRPGDHQIDTPVGTVSTRLHSDGSVTFTNVQSYRWKSDVEVEVPGHRRVIGDVAYGGNWFFLTESYGHELSVSNAENLTRFTQEISQSLEREGITGEGGAVIDHIGLFGPSRQPRVNSRNFVLCPGGMYDRSPCGTGTCAKLATLYAAGRLREGETWRQESIVGSVFEGRISVKNGAVIPRIRGRAYITGESELVIDPSDPFRHGISR